jgi:PPIC-type PPIASE domain
LNALRLLFREPLVGFLLVGGLLFAVLQATGADPIHAAQEREIEVSDATLARYLQMSSRSFSEQGVAARLGSLSAKDRAALVKDYVREEALYREALRWGLDREDYVLRRRLVQSLQYSLGAMETDATPAEQAMRKFYAANAARYTEPVRTAFTHVYFSAAVRGGQAAAREAALKAKRALAVEPAPDSLPGDRFPYFLNYVDQDRDFLASHFGAVAADALLALPPDAQNWQGPVESTLGVHLILVQRRRAAGQADFAIVREAVRHDYIEQQRRERQEQMEAAIIARYRVTGPG